MKINLIIIKKQILLLLIIIIPYFIKAQSTCPVIVSSASSGSSLRLQQQQQQQQQRCKCGIKTDGHIYIYCARKNLNKIPKFMRSSILYDELILSGNSISRISNNSFQGLRVKHLYLDDNQISYVESGSFIELANYLEELVLDINLNNLNNEIDYDEQATTYSTATATTTSVTLTPPMSIFENLLNLKILKLNGFTQMNTINAYLFNKTRKLEIIHLVNCNLNRIEINAFNGVELSLKELNLNHNQLYNEENLSLNLFQLIYKDYLKRLEVLSLTYNKIKRLIDYEMSSIDVSKQQQHDDDEDGNLFIDLSYNEINYIDESLFNKLRFKLIKLNLNNNELTNSNDDDNGNQIQQQQLNLKANLKFLKNLFNLRELYLDYNRIKYLNLNLFKSLIKLEVLSLKGNYIYQIENSGMMMGGVSNLKRLNLASNKLNCLNENIFQSFNKLKELYLEKNLNLNLNTTRIFNGLEIELKMLNLESNGLNNKQLESIKNLVNLETLKLGNNNLSSVNMNIFKGFSNLTNLDLENNFFKIIPYNVYLNKTLQNLNLLNNKICYINIDNLLNSYVNIKNINLNLNLLKCDCKLKTLRVWLDDNLKSSSNGSGNSHSLLVNAESVLLFNSLKCDGPVRHKGRLLMSLDINEFTCDDGTSNSDDACVDDVDFALQTTTVSTTSTTTSTIISSTSVTTTTTAGLSTNNLNKKMIKNLNIYLLNSNNILLKWQVDNENKLDINYFKLLINELSLKNVNLSISNSNILLIHSHLREYKLNSIMLKENRYYELCLVVVYDDHDEYEKTCQIISTKYQNITSRQTSSSPLAAVSNDQVDSYSSTNMIDSNLNLKINNNNNLNSAQQDGLFLKLETKQILFGSLIGALIVIILILIIIYLIKINKTKLYEKQQQLKLIEQQQQQQQNQQTFSGHNLLMPIDYNSLTANILDYNNTQTLCATTKTAANTINKQQQQQILLIRPINTATTTTNASQINNDQYTTAYSASQFYDKTSANCTYKKKKRNIFSIFNMFKNNSNKEQQMIKQHNHQQPQQQQLAAGFTSTTPFLLSDLNLFPSYVIKTSCNNGSGEQGNQHDTTTSSSSSSSSSSASTSSAFASFTPILSTTLETLTNSNNFNVNEMNGNLNTYQHMYHEITDTLLSNKSNFNKILMTNPQVAVNSNSNTTILTDLSPFLQFKINNTQQQQQRHQQQQLQAQQYPQQFLISTIRRTTDNDCFYENHSKEMFI